MSGKYYTRRQARNTDYTIVGSQYEHVLLWRRHHGVALDHKVFIIHHKNHKKKDNRVCADTSGHCPVWDCGNLGAMTRAAHIVEHKPGRMGGRKIPNKAGKRTFYCAQCGKEKSKHGRSKAALCRACYLAAATLVS